MLPCLATSNACAAFALGLLALGGASGDVADSASESGGTDDSSDSRDLQKF